MTSERPTVVFTASTGWTIRNFVHTGVFEGVRRSADLIVAASADLKPYFEGLQAEGRIDGVLDLPAAEPLPWRLLRQGKKAVLQGKDRISTAAIKMQSNAADEGGRRLRAVLWALQTKLSANWQFGLLEGIERRFGPAARDLPASATVLVNGSPFDPRDNALQRAAIRLGLPTLAIIPSWDNPSTKGAILTDVDEVLAWGEHQRRELLGYYPRLRTTDISISGIPQFDAYRRPLEGSLARAPFLGGLGIDPERRVILYATCSAKLFANEPRVVADLVEDTEAGEFGDAHLLVRCHPADSAGRYAAVADHPRVTVWDSTAGDSLQAWRPPSEELDVLAAMLLHSAVCINTASTMTLDAFACGRPVVNVSYDGGEDLPYARSVRRYYDYHHYRPIVRSGAVDVACSRQDLRVQVRSALDDPQRLAPARASVVEDFCRNPEEGSVRFITARILAHTLPRSAPA